MYSTFLFVFMQVQVPADAIVPVFLGNLYSPSKRGWMKHLVQNEREHLLNCMNEVDVDAFPDPRFPQCSAVALIRFAGGYDGQLSR